MLFQNLICGEKEIANVNQSKKGQETKTLSNFSREVTEASKVEERMVVVRYMENYFPRVEVQWFELEGIRLKQQLK